MLYLQVLSDARDHQDYLVLMFCFVFIVSYLSFFVFRFRAQCPSPMVTPRRLFSSIFVLFYEFILQ